MYSLNAAQYAELEDIYVCMWSFIWFVSSLHILIFGFGWINVPVTMYGSWIIYKRYKFVQELDRFCNSIYEPLMHTIEQLNNITMNKNK
jgi:hypothetical protein